MKIWGNKPCQARSLLFGLSRHWNEEMLDTACRLILNEVSLLGSAPGGKVEFKRTLIISFLFKFYLEVSQILKKMVNNCLHINFPSTGSYHDTKSRGNDSLPNSCRIKKTIHIRNTRTCWASLSLSVGGYEFREELKVEPRVEQACI